MGLASVPLLRDVTPASDSAVSLRWFFKVDVEVLTKQLNLMGAPAGGSSRSTSRTATVTVLPACSLPIARALEAGPEFLGVGVCREA